MKNLLMRSFAVLSLIVVAVAIYYYPKLNNIWRTIHLFDRDIIVENFTTMNQKWDTRTVRKPEEPFLFPKKEGFALPQHFTHEERDYVTQSYLDSSFTTGFLVLQKDSLVYERYFLGNTENTRHISWSVAKSYLSALFGIAVKEGHIRSLEEPVETYLPELIGSGYEGVKIKDVLQMSTGVKFNEDYGDFYSDINRWGRYFAWGLSQDDFAATLVRDKEPGSYHHYVSINTHVLGMLLVKTTGKSISEYMEEKLWKKIGAEHDAYWLIDDEGMEMALGGLNVTLRDYAKIGQLFLKNGKWQGVQVVPQDWVAASVKPDAPHLMPGRNPNSSHSLGYGYQWWIPEGEEGEFMAMGVYSQYIYVNPTTGTVIVKNSANHRYNERNNPYANTSVILELFRKIAHQPL